MSAILPSPPRRVCILRLSAIGDTCHVLPVVRALQRAWPDTRFTWIIGRFEARLMGLVPDIEFIVVDKHGGNREFARVRRLLHRRRFEVLLHMQLAIRASLFSTLVRAPVKLGFDRRRARELQWLFTTHSIPARRNEHVMDSMFGFAAALGVDDHLLKWDIPLPDEAREYAATVIPDRRPTLVISPCSSHRLRNWNAAGYAAVAEHAARMHGMRVVLAGGPGAGEEEMGAEIERFCPVPLVNTIGRDTLPKLLALLERADALITPDSGPAHMGTAAGTAVIGLYAATNPERSGPYLSQAWCVNRYDDAARRFLGKPAALLPWTAKIERPGVMDLIRIEDVTSRLDALAARGFDKRPGRL
jgi:heptosyltransferase I